jgi:hypothetical protein
MFRDVQEQILRDRAVDAKSKCERLQRQMKRDPEIEGLWKGNCGS